jgi:ATP/maltotriose-dependent transcriptional regulator MalT
VLDRSDIAGLPSTLVGRAGELALLARHAEAACAGDAGLVMLSGPAGIGKTSLLNGFLGGESCHGMTVLHGTCGQVVAGTGYGGVRALFGPLGLTEASAPESPLLRGSARRALPALSADPPDEDPGTSAVAYPVLHGLYWLAVNLMADGPLALVLDDVHWCDERSLRWLDFLLRRADELPLLVVLAQRTETEPAAPAALADIAAQHRTSPIHLEPLTEPDVAEVAQQFFTQPLEPSLVQRVTTVSGGNPLLLTRLLRELGANGAPPEEGVADRIDEVGRQVIAVSVRARLDRQPAWVRDVARAIAVLGEESADLVGALAGVPATLVEDAVTVLRRAEVVAQDRADLVHDVVRAALLEPVGEDALGALRTRAALLLSDAGRPAEEVANQLLLVPTLDQPWMPGVLRDAAARAETRGAPEAVARYLYRVLAVEPDSVPVRVQLAKALAEINPSESLRLLGEALDLPMDVRSRAKVALQFGLTCPTVQQSPAGVRVLGKALDALEAELGADPDPADRELRTLVESALLLTGSDEKATVAAIRDRVARMAMPSGDTPAQRQMLSMMTVVTAMDGRSADRTVEQARRALRSPGVSLGSWSLLPAALALDLADEVEESLDALDRVLKDAQDTAAVWTYVLTLSTRAFVLHGIGAVTDAMADAQTSVEIITDEAWAHNVTMPQTALATVLVDRGDPERAEALLDRITRPNMDRFVWEYHWYLTTRARARWALGDAETALGLIFDCGRSLEESGLANPAFLPWWADAACMLAAMRRAGEAGEIVERGAVLAERWGTPRVRGLAALARGVISKGEEGIAALTEAVELLSASPARGEQARAEYLLGKAYLDVGDQRGAREHLRTAADLAQRGGSLALANSARSLLVRAGGRMREITTSRADMLTGMERKVAGLAAAGASNRAIAESLFVTVRTVEMHLTSVYKKLGVSQRADLDTVLHAENAADPQAPTWILESRGRR